MADVTYAALQRLHDDARAVRFQLARILFVNNPDNIGCRQIPDEAKALEIVVDAFKKLRQYQDGFEGEAAATAFFAIANADYARKWSFGGDVLETAHGWLMVVAAIFARLEAEKFEHTDSWFGAVDMEVDGGQQVTIFVPPVEMLEETLAEVSEVLMKEYLLAVRELMRQGGKAELPDDTAKSIGGASVRGEKPAWVRAHLAYEMAEDALLQAGADSVTDEAAHAWLTENGPPEYTLPKVDTFTAYLRGYRGLNGKQKNSPRAGRTGRNVVERGDI